MSKWETRFQTEPTTNLRKVFVDEPELGEIVCRVYGTPDKKTQENRARLIASAPTLKQQRDDLRDSLEAIVDDATEQVKEMVSFKQTRVLIKLKLIANAKAEIAKCEA